MFDRSFTERYFQADFNNFFFLGNKITVTYKATLNNRKNVMSNSYILYSRLKKQFYLQLFSNIEEFVWLHNRQQWPRFDGYNPSIFFALFGEDSWQYF